jgi:hypothetical protein
VKDSLSRFMVAADPSSDQVNQAWGIAVLSTTANPPGKGLILDTSKVGYIAAREALSMRIGYTDDDFTRNIVRTVAEQRLVLCVTRPAAVLGHFETADVMTIVTVCAPFQVCHDGTVYGPDETPDVDDETALSWYAAGWVKPAKKPAAPAKPRAQAG